MIPEKKQNVKFPDNRHVLFLPLKQQIMQKGEKTGETVLTEKQTGTVGTGRKAFQEPKIKNGRPSPKG